MCVTALKRCYRFLSGKLVQILKWKICVCACARRRWCSRFHVSMRNVVSSVVIDMKLFHWQYLQGLVMEMHLCCLQHFQRVVPQSGMKPNTDTVFVNCCVPWLALMSDGVSYRQCDWFAQLSTAVIQHRHRKNTVRPYITQHTNNYYSVSQKKHPGHF